MLVKNVKKFATIVRYYLSPATKKVKYMQNN